MPPPDPEPVVRLNAEQTRALLAAQPPVHSLVAFAGALLEGRDPEGRGEVPRGAEALLRLIADESLPDRMRRGLWFDASLRLSEAIQGAAAATVEAAASAANARLKGDPAPELRVLARRLERVAAWRSALAADPKLAPIEKAVEALLDVRHVRLEPGESFEALVDYDRGQLCKGALGRASAQLRRRAPVLGACVCDALDAFDVSYAFESP